MAPGFWLEGSGYRVLARELSRGTCGGRVSFHKLEHSEQHYEGDIHSLTVVGPNGRVGIPLYLEQLLFEWMLGLEMLNPRP